jgi:hypothetical protein
MSDTTSGAQPPEPAQIDFERAEFAGAAGEQVECGVCQQAIVTEYWQSLGKVLCASCRELVQRSADEARRGATLGKAFLFGGLVAFGCGVGYAIFVGVTHIQFALVTIGIGWAVGRAVQRVTRGFGGTRHQVLAVVLTYFATTMGYFPAVIKALGKGGDGTEQTVASTASTSAPAPPAAPTATGTAQETTPPPATPAGRPPAAEGPGLAASLVIVAVVSMFLMLAAPLLEVTGGFSGVLGLLIIFFGLRTAWRVSRGLEASVTGPHAVAAATES